jgi:S1-C subfamily serine protease
LGAGVLAVPLAMGLAGCTSSSPSAANSATGATATSTPVALGSGPAAALQEQYEAVIMSVLPSVVQINTQTGTGSGVVYDDNGDIVTNAHVIGDSSTVKVLPATGGAQLEAKVLGTFPADDLAVIRVTSGGGTLRKATFGSTTDITTGQIVLAMGNPLGLTGSVTQGIISATGRTVSESDASGGGSTTIADALQTSAAINGGNSGGALVNLSGQVVGIPTAAARDPEAGAAPGIGFAIPANTVTNIADQLIAHGKVTQSSRAALGITAHTTVSSSGEPVGVAIASVTADGPAAKAGLQEGDVITSVAGQKTPTQGALTAALATLKPDQQVDLTYSRSGTSHTTKVTLGTLTS